MQSKSPEEAKTNEKPAKLRSVKRKLYLEIYISKDGNLLFTPVTAGTAELLKSVSITKDTQNIYCG